jgi:hypothetical protein
VAVQDERTTSATTRGPAGNDVAFALHIPRKRGGAFGAAKRVGVQVNAAWFEAAVGEGLFHDPLSGFFVSEGRRRLDEADEEVLHPADLGGDRLEDSLVGDGFAWRGAGSHPTLPSRIWSVFRSE